uniref:Nodule-specific cysteine-rich peptide G36 n=1 Tax=Pisum sativum TaxID=3888 RepID=A0A7T8IG06_PEA|nr:nodule-specific cysteine-rich peptide G36 [Pisum sativum]
MKEVNMIGIVKFVYVMIIFLSFFLVGKNVHGLTCLEDIDCPGSMCAFTFYPICVYGICDCIGLALN